ncbi:alpha-glucuronidase family glycosyl hydrolase [Cohnella boryungensis]|uniref:Xylan alpha-1,2-glucuronidase n=1 Tax=Cohnella boryungensis TaxID=768479 RepID=A0ABV8SJV0_9BACL
MDKESGYEAWLRYRPCESEELLGHYRKYFNRVWFRQGLEIMRTAMQELSHGAGIITRCTVRLCDEGWQGAGIAIGLIDDFSELKDLLGNEILGTLPEDGYLMRSIEHEGLPRLVLAARSANGMLYAVFHLLRLMKSVQRLDRLNIAEHPRNALRMINQWDNMDGSIERGYAGRSIFYRDDEFVSDWSRIRDYARLLASVGINAISLNNVNVHERETLLITDELLPKVAQTASIFSAYGLRTYLSINFASPRQIGGLPTADPLDEGVRAWWKERADAIYRHIPDFGGFLVKADSEFRPGPYTYGRNHADGANMLADALEPHGGLVIWRCFVYDCLQDWRDRKPDRARAAYDHYTPLDGRFRENVLLQIKNGPMDFQVREPVSPLFGGLSKTNQMLELQITQEYTGQQKHLCYLPSQWKEIVDFDTFALGEGTSVAQIVSGKAFGRRHGGVAAVSNIGDDQNWTGHLLAQANLYGYGRLSWNMEIGEEEIAWEWTCLTFGKKEKVTDTICCMLLDSWSIYESYTAPLGVGWMVQPNHHYGPSVDGYEYSKWGTYHFADCHGIGVNRTLLTGTGYSAQYPSPQFERYESLQDCPDELLLFFHHVPYTHRLQSGKTVIQHIYDTHYEGAERAEGLVERWKTLEDDIDEGRYRQVLDRLQEQAEHAKEWRDVINTYFLRKSGIQDIHKRPIY